MCQRANVTLSSRRRRWRKKRWRRVIYLYFEEVEVEEDVEVKEEVEEE
jgi:hypothetical protein